MSKKCSCCGADLEDNALFCTVCGQRQKPNQNAVPKKEVRLKGQPKEQKAKQEDGTGRKSGTAQKATISVILGFITWGLAFTPGIFVSIVTCIVGVVFGVRALQSEQKKMAIAGLVMNGLFLAIMVLAMLGAFSS